MSLWSMDPELQSLCNPVIDFDFKKVEFTPVQHYAWLTTSFTATETDNMQPQYTTTETYIMQPQ